MEGVGSVPADEGGLAYAYLAIRTKRVSERLRGVKGEKGTLSTENDDLCVERVEPVVCPWGGGRPCGALHARAGGGGALASSGSVERVERVHRGGPGERKGERGDRD